MKLFSKKKVGSLARLQKYLLVSERWTKISVNFFRLFQIRQFSFFASYTIIIRSSLWIIFCGTSMANFSVWIILGGKYLECNKHIKWTTKAPQVSCRYKALKYFTWCTVVLSFFLVGIFQVYKVVWKGFTPGQSLQSLVVVGCSLVDYLTTIHHHHRCCCCFPN